MNHIYSYATVRMMPSPVAHKMLLYVLYNSHCELFLILLSVRHFVPSELEVSFTYTYLILPYISFMNAIISYLLLSLFSV